MMPAADRQERAGPGTNVDPAAVDTVLEMVGSKGAPKAKLFDSSIVDRLAHEGFIDKLYKGAKP